jgi:signal transduction histidine kinase
MPKVGESYCFLIPNDPSVCPFIEEHETVLLRDLDKRLRKKCLGCEYFRSDLEQLRHEQSPLFEVALMLLDETLWRGKKLAAFSESLDIRDEMLDILLRLSNTIELTLDPHEILYKGLVAFTAGTSFGFNRGVALLTDHDELRGEFALGPLDREEASHIWREINDKGLTVADLLRYVPDTYERERAKFQQALRRLTFTIDEPPFQQAFEMDAVLRVDPVMEIAPALREFYQQTTFWVLPLFSHLKVPLGAILVDNFLNQPDRALEDDDTRAMRIFAREISLALERGLAYAQLQEKLGTLEEAHRQIQENQAKILRLKEELAVGEMVLQLTHSVKNPIVAIGGLARQLNRKTSQHPIYSKYTHAIVQEATRLEETLQDFVKFVEARYPSEHEPVSVNRMVTVLCQEKERLLQSMKIVCHLRLKDGLPDIRANRRQIYNCLENLVTNAMEAMPHGGDLSIETDFEREQVIVKVADTGAGISEEGLSNLFKPFFTTKPTGSGLGLYTAKQIIENLGGSIHVACELGSGCTVFVRIPPAGESNHGNHSGD